MLGKAGYSRTKCLSVQPGVHGGMVHDASVWKRFSSVSFSAGEKGGPWV